MTETALFRYACEMYEYLNKHAVYYSKTKEKVFKGTLKDAFASTGASSRYYTPIKAILDSPTNDPCITLLQRGTGKRTSLVRLNHPPPDDWKEITNKDLTGGREAATLTAEIERAVRELVSWREQFGEVNIQEALRDHENRLTKLERGNGNGKTKKV